MAEGEKVNKKLRLPKTVVIAIGIVLLLALVAGSAYFYLQFKKSQDLLKNPTFAAQVETQDLVEKVGKHMALPKDEQPTVATVSDASKLKDQPFFAKAKNGFKVLIYTKSKKAILYDPKADKIIEVTVLNLEQQAANSPTPAPVKVALYNGTSIVGFTSTIEKQLKDKGVNVEIVEKANASSSAYTKTLVIDLSAKNPSLSKELATFLSGQVAILPNGEQKPKDADILVILGK